MLAYTASIRSPDVFRRVGACALDFDNRTLGISYNGLAPGKDVGPEFWEDRDKRRPFMMHAEINLLSLFKRNDCRILAVTTMPCESCCRALCAYSIPEVVYCEDYTDSELTKEIFKFYGVTLTQITQVDLQKYAS